MDKQIIEALLRLDPTVDEHWTDGGAPRIDAVASLMGVKPTELKRDMITSAAPHLTRDTFAQFVEAQGDDPEGDDEAPEPQAAPVYGDAKEEMRAEYNARIEAGRAELAELQVAANKAREAVDAKEREIDEIIKERDRVLPRKHPTVVLKEHLQRQHELRAQQVRERGGLSPLDQRLRARKRSDTRPLPQSLPAATNPMT